MKTTVEIPNELFRAAKATAIRRGTTLKALITRSLEREVLGIETDGKPFVVDEDGLPHLPPRGASVTNDLVQSLLDDEE